MEIKITLFVLILGIVLINTILEHIFNWAIRYCVGGEVILAIYLYCLKTGLLIWMLHELLK